jgi:adenylate cyclase class 2
MIEAELKARLRDPDAVRAALESRAPGEPATYRDAYYDTPGGDLEHDGRELRVRTIETPGAVRHLLTYKGAPVDEGSGSKPEYETAVESADMVTAIVEQLGYVPLIRLTKECLNFRLSVAGRDFLATIVRVPELDDTFIEIETQATEPEVTEALAAVRSLLDDLGVPEGDLTDELYTDAVRGAREAGRCPQ